MFTLVSFITGILFAALGGELFVRGTIGLARYARVAPGVIAATVSAFATSSPEFSVCITSSLQGFPQITMGDSLGSNVVNIALILGIALCISGVACPRKSIQRNFSFASFAPFFTGILIIDGQLSRIDGGLLLILFSIWLYLTVKEALEQRITTPSKEIPIPMNRIILFNIAGLVLLIAAGNLIVVGARSLAETLGVQAFVIGATIVAIGTSMPELATTIVAKLRGYDEISLGTLLGSNLFNGLFILSVAALIHPIDIQSKRVQEILAFGLVSVLASLPGSSGIISRSRGTILLTLYTLYLSSIFL